jgi:hypothetical protein
MDFLSKYYEAKTISVVKEFNFGDHVYRVENNVLKNMKNGNPESIWIISRVHKDTQLWYHSFYKKVFSMSRLDFIPAIDFKKEDVCIPDYKFNKILKSIADFENSELIEKLNNQENDEAKPA